MFKILKSEKGSYKKSCNKYTTLAVKNTYEDALEKCNELKKDLNCENIIVVWRPNNSIEHGYVYKGAMCR